ncbi:hypothetical protein V8C86DRAFT_2817615 [Haematococcus lacustris]
MLACWMLRWQRWQFELFEGMERVLSASGLDDLVGGLWRYTNNVGFGRSESEAAFQEFLKRIPSASNLAAIAGSTGQLASGDVPTSMSLGLGSYLPQAGMPSQAQQHSYAAAPGMPRVSSLDLLARLVTQSPYPANVTPAPSSLMKLEAPIAPQPLHTAPAMSLMELASLPLSAALQNMPAAGPPLAPAINPAAAAAAALQLQNQLGTLSRLQQAATAVSNHHHKPQHSSATRDAPQVSAPASQTTSDNDDNPDRNEQRRARRMLSNRESARRSRRRKQEHVSRLEDQLNDVQAAKRQAEEAAATQGRRCVCLEEENQRLKEDNERLRDELRLMRSQLTDRNGWRREGLDAEGDTHSAKRLRQDSGEVVPHLSHLHQLQGSDLHSPCSRALH